MQASSHSLILGLSLDPAGHHPAAWRLPSFDPAWVTSPGHFLALGQKARDAGLDFILAGHPVRSSAVDDPTVSQSAQLEPLSLAAALMQVPDIGIAAAVPMTYWEPFNTARAFAALDNLSAGRSAWLAVPAASPADAANFPRHAAQFTEKPYERALEYAELTRALWDSWEDGALLFDKERAIFTDADKVHRISFQKTYFYCDGPLNAPRPVQGHPPMIVSDTCDAALPLAALADVVISDTSCASGLVWLRSQLAALQPARAPALLAALDFVVEDSAEAAQAARAQLDEMGGPAPRRGLTFTGTPEELAAMLADLHGQGICDGFQLLPARTADDMAGFVEKVLPLLPPRAPWNGGTLRARLGLAQPPGRA